VPIIALTANAIVGNERMFLQSGFQAFLPKPIDVQRMDLVLRQWVRDQTRETEGPAEPEEEPEFPAEQHIDDIDGLDMQKGLARFGGDSDALLQALRSYAKNTPALLEQIRVPAEVNLPEYTIIVHGIKSSSYSIGAMTTGSMAEKLEHAAQAGNFGFVGEHNAAFVESLEKLLAALAALPEQSAATLPAKAEPDAGTLDKLREACAKYDMDGVDRAMAELEGFTYDNGQELIAWLRERVSAMEFRQILDRLAEK
jgi:HPt (histidine-containing phosphotransfer) domain-containing protein